MDQYAILARFTVDAEPQDLGIESPPPVAGHEADRLACLARSRPVRQPAPTTAWWRRRLRASGADDAGRGGDARRRGTGGGAAGKT
jgi:hypothetical protein